MINFIRPVYVFRRYKMKKNVCIISVIISALMLLQLTSCVTLPPEDTEQDSQTLSETVTESAETNIADHASVTLSDGKATVTTPSGLSYAASGYESADGDTFRIKEGFAAEFKDGIKEDFNRMTFEYSSDKDFKLYITYTQDSCDKTDMFYVEAASDGCFNCLISSYLNGGKASEFKSLKADICTGEESGFIIEDVKVENIQQIDRSTYYLENDRFKVGVKLGWGGGVNYIEDKTSNVKNLTNLINSHDTGRLVQQSYYGTAGNDEYQPGTSFNTKWTYNPVQGGDQYGNASRLIDFKVTDNSIYVKAQPQDWSLDGQLTPSYMENTYTLYGDYIKVDNRFTDFSGWEHPYHGQELPAFYTVSFLSRFTWYNGTNPWTDDELSYNDDLNFWGDAQYVKQCNKYLKVGNTETWCAWSNPQSDFGIGLYVPNVDVLKAGRYNFNNSKKADNDATNYVAPVNTMKLVSYGHIEYSYLITTGSVEQIRATFKANKDFAENASLHENYISERVFGSSEALLEGKFNNAESVSMLSNIYNSDVEYCEEYGAVKIRAKSDNCDPHVSVNYETDTPLYAEEYKTLTIDYMIPADNASPSYSCDLFLCTGATSAPDGNKRVRQQLICDGEYHTLELDLSKYSFWSGEIHEIRFDYFDFCSSGDVMYLKAFSLS